MLLSLLPPFVLNVSQLFPFLHRFEQIQPHSLQLFCQAIVNSGYTGVRLGKPYHWLQGPQDLSKGSSQVQEGLINVVRVGWQRRGTVSCHFVPLDLFWIFSKND